MGLASWCKNFDFKLLSVLDMSHSGTLSIYVPHMRHGRCRPRSVGHTLQLSFAHRCRKLDRKTAVRALLILLSTISVGSCDTKNVGV